MRKHAKVVLGAVALTAMGATAYVGTFCLAKGGCYKCIFGEFGDCGRAPASLTADQREAMATDLARVAHGGVESELRGWILSHSPAVIEETVLAIDNKLDANARGRLAVLSSISSLRASGLPEKMTKEWAGTLHRLAMGVLHDGPERADFVARAYLMEGKRDEAAAEYARYPEHQAAKIFFQQNPELRSPASK
jgi:hypothetical protein